MRPRVGARSNRAAVAAIPLLLAACIPGVLTVGASDGGPSTGDSSSPGPDGAGGDSSNPSGDAGADQASKDASGEHAGDSAQGVDAPAADSSDAGPLPDGYIQCPGTSVQCQVGGVGECCDTIYGSIASDGGYVYSLTMAVCEAVGGANCGSLEQVGPSFTENFPQTCSTVADCATGTACCVVFNAGGIALGQGIGCASSCPSPDRIICRTTADCTGGLTCKPETDSILSHVYARYCQ
ncbi:MAG TPA: hypothetical protein VIF09_05725 [Polyangiaceae bacterium]|jgi:hypothetical protein